MKLFEIRMMVLPKNNPSYLHSIGVLREKAEEAIEAAKRHYASEQKQCELLEVIFKGEAQISA